jgi:CRP/FNR family transcriptional regulator, cyclic AMP receptor protein
VGVMSIGHSNLKWELKRHALFATFSEEDLELLLNAGNTKVFKAREMIFHEGDTGGSMYVVLSGKVKVSAFSSDGREVVLSFAGPGEVLGEITLLDGGPRTASACPIETTRMFHLARQDFLPVLQRNPAAALHIISVLCERLRSTNRMVEDTIFLTAAPRLARAILRLVELHGHADGEHWRLDMHLPQSTLGAHVGLMRESVNRQMRAWQEDGVLRTDEDGLLILRRNVLEQVAELG